MEDNEYVNVVFHPKNENNSKAYISFRDLKDYANGTSGFTRKVRGIEKAMAKINETFNKNTKFWDIVHLLDEYKLQCHTYCAMD